MRGGRGTGRGGPMARGVAAGRGRAEPGRVSFGLCGTGAMGGGGSAARRVTFEADENDHVTVVKGVRLSETVINRMKETSSPGARPSSRQRSASGDHDLRGATAVNEEELKKRIAEELALEQARRETEAHKRLKQDQMYVRDELGKVLERERTASNEHLTRAILRERAATEEERVKAERFAKQLEEKDRELKKHDAYYKEQLARLEERVRHLIWGFYLPRRLSRSINLKSAQFYKVTTEQYQKAANEVEARFNRACSGEEDRGSIQIQYKPINSNFSSRAFFSPKNKMTAHLQGRQIKRGTGRAVSRAAAITAQSVWPFEKPRPVSYYIRNHTSEDTVQF
uniref:Coiled-coil-helix-coiled-coil-helix domain containing 3 n=1 Tax=Crocodylus porosus TaxID=8502 RepID=A0A7M4E0E8_CROPO